MVRFVNVMCEIKISYLSLCEALFSGSSLESFLNQIYPDLEDDSVRIITRELQMRFLSHYNIKLKSSHNKQKLLKKYGEWLKGSFAIKLLYDDRVSCPNTSGHGGRPIKDFDECSEMDKRHKVQNLRSTTPGKINTAFDPDNALALITQAKISRYQ